MGSKQSLSLRCRLGLHRCKGTGVKTERTGNECYVREVYRNGKYLIPMERCVRCGIDREDTGAIVFRDIERSTTPMWSCICGIGNRAHQRRFDEQMYRAAGREDLIEAMNKAEAKLEREANLLREIRRKYSA